MYKTLPKYNVEHIQTHIAICSILTIKNIKQLTNLCHMMPLSHFTCDTSINILPQKLWSRLKVDRSVHQLLVYTLWANVTDRHFDSLFLVDECANSMTETDGVGQYGIFPLPLVNRILFCKAHHGNLFMYDYISARCDVE